MTLQERIEVLERGMGKLAITSAIQRRALRALGFYDPVRERNLDTRIAPFQIGFVQTDGVANPIQSIPVPVYLPAECYIYGFVFATYDILGRPVEAEVFFLPTLSNGEPLVTPDQNQQAQFRQVGVTPSTLHGTLGFRPWIFDTPKYMEAETNLFVQALANSASGDTPIYCYAAVVYAERAKTNDPDIGPCISKVGVMEFQNLSKSTGPKIIKFSKRSRVTKIEYSAHAQIATQGMSQGLSDTLVRLRWGTNDNLCTDFVPSSLLFGGGVPVTNGPSALTVPGFQSVRSLILPHPKVLIVNGQIECVVDPITSVMEGATVLPQNVEIAVHYDEATTPERPDPRGQEVAA